MAKRFFNNKYIKNKFKESKKDDFHDARSDDKPVYFLSGLTAQRASLCGAHISFIRAKIHYLKHTANTSNLYGVLSKWVKSGLNLGNSNLDKPI